MISAEKLQSLYDDLFGLDDQDGDDGVAEASELTVQAGTPGYGSHAIATATRPAITFEKPTGLLLFRSWFSQQQQASTP